MKPSSLILVATLASMAKAEATDGLEPGSVLPYLFQIPGNATIAAVFFILSISHFILVWRTKAKWALCLPIAEATSGLGYIVRIVCRSNQQSVALYAVSDLFVILSPAAFLAFNYMMYSRLIVAIDPDVTLESKRRTKSRFSILPPRIFGLLFVWSDVVTFLIQASGGGLQATKNNAKLGDYIFLVGVALQAASYVTFILLVVLSHARIGFRNEYSKVSLILYVLYFASICILIRGFYRVAEMALGYHGVLYRTEIYTFLLDALPLVLANTAWVIFWPPTHIAQAQLEAENLDEKLSPSNSSLKDASGSRA